MTTYFRPPGRNTARSVALSPWGAGLFLGTWPAIGAFNWDGASLSSITLPTASYIVSGFAGVAADSSGNAWAVTFTGGAMEVPVTGSGSTFRSPSGIAFTGTAIASTHPYFLSSTGAVFGVSGAVLTPISGSFGEEASALVGRGSVLYATLPNSGHLGLLTLASPTSGTLTTVATPMTVPASLAVSAAGVVVAGWNLTTLASGATSVAMSPVGDHAAAVYAPTGTLMLLTGSDPSWTISQVITGLTSPEGVAWASGGQQVLVADSAGVDIYNLTGGSLAHAQTIALSATTSVAVTPDGLTALACETTSNTVRVLHNATNVWSASETITVSNSPANMATLSDTEAVCSYAPGGTGGAAEWFALISGTWQSEIVVSGLGFAVSGLAVDSAGNAYVCGTTGTTPTVNGHLAMLSKSGVIANISYAGRADAILVDQSQIAVLDTGA